MGVVEVFSATDVSDLGIEQACIEKDIVIDSKNYDSSKQKLIRNVCILAHVDHGKTTLADNLIASYGGGLLHPNQVGERRFMDYLDEERRRAITMKSSSISLLFKDYSVNLIDSPGHMDFCGEVSSAARLSDGALIVVDAVDGVQIQTHAVLRQAWIEKLTPCLVLNKIDQMSWKLRLSPMEAYERLKMIIDYVNRIVSGYKSEQYLSDIDSAPSYVPSSEKSLEEDYDDIFQPQKGNVVFSSAIHGWGFRISDFVKFLAPMSGSSVDKLQRDLWPLYSEKKSRKKPMFPQYILKPIWEMYDTVFNGSADDGLLRKVVRKLNLSIPSRELQNRDPKAVFKSVMSRWLPLSDTILSMVVECIPDPISGQSFRISRLLPITESLPHDNDFGAFTEAELVRKSVEVYNSSSNAPCVAFVSKMFAIPANLLPHGDVVNNLDSPECFLAFARIFSGELIAGQRIFVLSALYDPLNIELKQNHMQEAEVQALYLMMGQGLKPVESAEAGNIIAIKGLGQHILKSATLSSTTNCWPFSSMTFQVAPTVKMAVEPSNPADMDAFEKGLRLLNRADPFIEVTRSSRGEYILAAAGEVHMERCLKDLRERFAKVSLEVSPPIVYYKETIEVESAYLLDTLKLFESCDYVEKTTPNGRCAVRVKVMKLPEPLIKLLDESSELLKDILGGKSGQALKNFRCCIVENKNSIEALKNRMIEVVESDFPPGITEIEKDRARVSWIQFFKRIWALGPFQTGPNILITPETGSNVEGSVHVRGDPYVSEKLGFHESRDNDGMSDELSSITNEILREVEGLESSVLSGFQLATSAGPLCDEPMWGLVFSIEARVFPLDRQPDQDGIFTGQLMIAVKEACRAAVLQSKPRVVEPWYLCELNTATENLRAMAMCGRSSVFSLLKQKRAQVIGGSSAFTVKAYVPVAESFGLADSLIRQTSGVCTPLLVFGEWRTLHDDPFCAPRSDDEIEKSGDGSSVPQNTARKIIDGVRKQKGLPVDEKVVRHATKQRTLSRK